MNERAIHVCVVGNFDIAPPSEPTYQFLAKYIVRPLMARYGIPRDRIVRHSDYAHYKTCPGTKFDMEHLRSIC